MQIIQIVISKNFFANLYIIVPVASFVQCFLQIMVLAKIVADFATAGPGRGGLVVGLIKVVGLPGLFALGI